MDAICASPDADEPRLQFADWLEKHGDPSRAEYIRLQIDLEQKSLKPATWLKLTRRVEKLEATHKATWVSRLPELDGIIWFEDFRRGFPWSVAARNFASFRDHADTIFRTAPIQSLGILELPGTKRLAAMPELSRLTRLILQELRLGPKDAEALATSPYLSGLQALHASRNHLGDKGTAALARSPYLKNLMTLDISYNGIGPAGVRALAQSPHLVSTRDLALAGNEIGDEGAVALVKSPYLQNITGLTLWDIHDFGDAIRQQLRKRFGSAVSFMD
jgi:uncharacterized protein (TIGR02996 family)